MRTKIVLIIAIVVCLLSGCGEYSRPIVVDHGTSDSDNSTTIYVVGARPGLKYYRIEEADDGINLIMHYDKME